MILSIRSMVAMVATAAMALLAAACSGGDNDGNPDYRACSDSDPCDAAAQCAFGLCVPRCNGGEACTEGMVCFAEGCRDACDDAHPCTQAFSCIDSVCTQDPCHHPDFWPLSIASDTLPIVVHYRDPSEIDQATEVLDAMEYSWVYETTTLGFATPVSDQGRCGGDANFDVFLWRSYRSGGVEAFEPNPDTPWDDDSSYMILDPWGPYGGDMLKPLVAHELNHGIQASYDWWDSPIVYEMTSQFVEGMVYPEISDYKQFFYDFQGTPDWSFDKNDDYATWYMYGSSLYLFYLRDVVFKDDLTFVSRMWAGMKNPPGVNEPDFEDSLEVLLAGKGSSFQASLEQFSRWRWYTSTRDDGHHFAGGSTFPPSALVKIEQRVRVTTKTIAVAPGPMMLGVQYIQLYREPGDPTTATIQFDGDAAVAWSVQVVPGLMSGSDGDTLDVSAGPAALDFGGLDERTLIILALPLDADDPDTRTDARFAYSLQVKAP